MAVLTTSGTYTYSATAIRLINSALRACQAVAEDESPSGTMLETALDAMAAMCAGWQGTGIHVWSEEEGILFLQKDQIEYQIGAGSPDKVALIGDVRRTTLSLPAAAGSQAISVTDATNFNLGNPVGIVLDNGTLFWTTIAAQPNGTTVPLAALLPFQATNRNNWGQVFTYRTPLDRPLKIMRFSRLILDSGIETPMGLWARLDYQNQPNKYSPGVPTAAFYDPAMGNGAYSAPAGKVHCWPSPYDSTFAIRFTAQRPIQDINSLAQIPDFPREWNAAIKWNLALELCAEYGVPTEQVQLIQAQAAKWFDSASRWDREAESVVFGVAMSSGQRRG